MVVMKGMMILLWLSRTILLLNLKSARTSAAASTFKLPSFALNVRFLFGIGAWVSILDEHCPQQPRNQINVPSPYVAQTRSA